MDRGTLPPSSPPGAEEKVDLPRLRASIERHEGRCRRPCKDPEGVLTAGVGHDLEAGIMARSWSGSGTGRLPGARLRRRPVVVRVRDGGRPGLDPGAIPVAADVARREARIVLVSSRRFLVLKTENSKLKTDY